MGLERSVNKRFTLDGAGWMRAQWVGDSVRPDRRDEVSAYSGLRTAK
ncbi:hypothetical protein B0G83_10148 [Paraburkholderia sp. BL21I4N1]|nr:hypothetical protein B0G83_10148 [Paraburkholderia sp. BL21I4N1]